MHHGRWMHFRLAQIAPPALHTHFRQFFIELPKPVSGLWTENINQARIAKIKIINKGFSRTVFTQKTIFRGFFPFFRAGQNKRFCNQDGFYIFFLKITHHQLRSWKGIFQKLKVAHMALNVLAKPVNVYNDRIQWNAVLGKFTDCFPDLFFGMIAKTAGKISKDPPRR